MRSCSKRCRQSDIFVAEALSRPNGCKSRVYQQIFTYTKIGFAKLYDVKRAITAADLLVTGCCRSPTSTASQLCWVLTDRGGEYSGDGEWHEHELYFAIRSEPHRLDHSFLT